MTQEPQEQAPAWDLVVTEEFSALCNAGLPDGQQFDLEEAHAIVRSFNRTLEEVVGEKAPAAMNGYVFPSPMHNQRVLIAIVSLGRNESGMSLLQYAFVRRSPAQTRAARALFVAFVNAIIAYDDQFETTFEVNQSCPYSPFGYACEQGLFEVVRCILQMQSEDVPTLLRASFRPVTRQCRENKQPLLHGPIMRNCAANAVQLVCVGRMQECLSAEPDMPMEEKLEYADECDSRILKMLLDNGVSCDVQDQGQCTPLMHVAHRGSHALCKLLLDKHQANVNARDQLGRTALWMAVTSPACDVDTVALLVSYGASPFVADAQGRSLVALLRTAQPTEEVKRALALYESAMRVYREMMIESYRSMSGMEHVKVPPNRAASRIRYLPHQYQVGEEVQQGDECMHGTIRSTTHKVFHLKPMHASQGFDVQVDSIDYAFPGQMIEVMAHLAPSNLADYKIPVEWHMTLLPNVHDHGAQDPVTFGMGAHTIVLRLADLLAHKGMLKKALGEEKRRMKLESMTEEERRAHDAEQAATMQGVQLVKDACDYEQLMYLLDRNVHTSRHGAEVARLVYHRDLRDADFCMHMAHEDACEWTCMTHVFVTGRSVKTLVDGPSDSTQSSVMEAWYPEVHLKVRLVREDACAMLLEKANEQVRALAQPRSEPIPVPSELRNSQWLAQSHDEHAKEGELPLRSQASLEMETRVAHAQTPAPSPEDRYVSF